MVKALFTAAACLCCAAFALIQQAPPADTSAANVVLTATEPTAVPGQQQTPEAGNPASAQPPAQKSATAGTIAGAAGGTQSEAGGRTANGQPSESAANEQPVRSTTQLRKELFHGRVVMLRPALKQRGVQAFEEFDAMVALETSDNQLIPIIPDWRGRAFYQDARLRDRAVDLVGYRRPGIPFLQILMVFTFDDQGTRQYTDYWCDICSIPMYEIKPCDCCQADIRLRFQKQDLPAWLNQNEKPASAAPAQ